ncbi:MAG: hypothetical protein HC843_09235 [Sphingomonadales bacterium]|nr:hypothetical protein [Sphingomonadales bacterium]
MVSVSVSAQPSSRATAIGRVSAKIIKAERISYRGPTEEDRTKTDRQISQRGAMPITEFY